MSKEEIAAENLLDNDNDKLLQEVIEKAGLKTLAESNDGWNEANVLSTGIAAVDVGTRVGGYPFGRMYEIYGDESAGKTTNFLHTVASAQRRGIPVIYIDAENALDLNYCATLGVDTNKMLVHRPDSLEDAMDLMIKQMKGIKGRGDQPGILFVFDSVPAIKSMEVMDKDAGERSMMAEANRWAENGPKLVTLAARTNSILLLVNQTRADTTATNARYAKKQTPGGKFIKFAASMRLEISAKAVTEGKDNVRIGQDTKVKFVKNKVGGPGAVAEYFLPVGNPVDWASDVIEAAMDPAVGLVLADTKWDENEGLISSKSAYTLPLNDTIIDLIREDELDLWLEDGEQEAIDRDDYDEDGNPNNLNTIDNFVSAFGDDQQYLSVRFKQKFVDSIADFPRLIDYLEKAVRNKLREPKKAIEARKLRPDASKLNTRRLLSVAERRAAAAESVGTSAADADEEKPKRGRPAKDVSEVVSTDEEAPKRGRGRPRKSEDA